MSSQPLLPNGSTTTPAESNRRRLVSTILLPILLIVGVVYVLVSGEHVPKDPKGLAEYYLKSSPVIDGHIDVPIMMKVLYGNDITKFDLDGPMPSHFDIPRARKGHLGGFFWSIYADCSPDVGEDFLNATNIVRDVLETIDLSNNLIEKYSDTFAMCRTSEQVFEAIKEGKIASMFGLEGGHMLGNSLGVLRTYYELGVRYMTLTHGCNNAFADSGGIFTPTKPKWGGLSPLGRQLIKEMNRLGILIDLSHVSDQTALQALSLTRAPVMLSHSAARHFNNISRNVADEVLDRLGRGKGKVDGVVMVNFYPAFLNPTKKANISDVADHIEYIAKRAGKHQWVLLPPHVLNANGSVGIGTDYDGIEHGPDGLEDVSKYPALFAELIERGWNENELSLLAGGNFLRVMKGMEKAALQIRREGKGPNMAKYDKRHDLDPMKPPF